VVWYDNGVDTNSIQVGINFQMDGEIRLMLLVQTFVASVDSLESAESFHAWNVVVVCAIVEYKCVLFLVSLFRCEEHVHWVFLFFFFKHSRSCALWICSTQTNCKQTLCCHRTATVGRCVAKLTCKVEFQELVSPPWLCAYLHCFVCAWISD
jgi:hypothetical protein